MGPTHLADTAYLIDTNIAIYFLDGVLPDHTLPFVLAVMDAGPRLSVATQIELVGRFPNPEKRRLVEAFVSRSTLFPLTAVIVQQTIAIKQTHKIKLGDAIIAATALVHNLTLVTRNVSDFQAIAGLIVVNPFAPTGTPGHP
ncbi:type II toxin-antitoxin system VapC family toxin [uncultured Fibrella sp.]|uniref:type II toxin-antitoxin system VapC family toxin n=1 Tax=uncultured Fibrella sp. TaxID=1284596 RepID=UPI0035C96869